MSAQVLVFDLTAARTPTLAGQIVVEGFLRLTIPRWAGRLLTRGRAIASIAGIAALCRESGTASLLALNTKLRWNVRT